MMSLLVFGIRHTVITIKETPPSSPFFLNSNLTQSVCVFATFFLHLFQSLFIDYELAAAQNSRPTQTKAPVTVD